MILKKEAVLVIISFLICMTIGDVRAESEAESNEGAIGSGEMIVSYVLEKEDLFNLKVHVSKGGTVYDGAEQIRDGEIIYSLPLGGVKSFRIQPDSGYSIERIRYQRPIFEDEKNLPLSENLTVQIESTDTILEVTFKKIDIVPSEPVDNDEDEEKPDMIIVDDMKVTDNTKIKDSTRVTNNKKVTYETKEEIESQKTIETQPVNTGDITERNQLLLLLIAAMFSLIHIVRRKWKEAQVREILEQWK